MFQPMISFETFTAEVSRLCGDGIELRRPPIAKYDRVSVVAGKVRYTRGHSVMRVALIDLHETLSTFGGRLVGSPELRTFRPHVFDSNARPSGHTCKVGLFFSILLELGLASKLEGKGVRGDPFSVETST